MAEKLETKEHKKKEVPEDELTYIREMLRSMSTSQGFIAPHRMIPQVIFTEVEQHFSSIVISRFRGLENFILEKLNRINIFAGANNSGKTSVLEAVYLLTNLNNIYAFFEIERQRAKLTDGLYAKWFENNFLFNIELTGVFNGEQVNVSIESGQTTDPIDKNGYLATLELHSEVAKEEKDCRVHLYSGKESQFYYKKIVVLCNSIMTNPYNFNENDLQKAHAKAFNEKKIDVVIDFIRNRVDPGIQKIELINMSDMNRFSVTSDRFDRSVDLTSFGEGVLRIFQIGLSMAYASNGVLLIDEFETAIHKSLLVDFSRFVHQLAREFNVQVFLTSHSKECIDAFVENDYHPEEITGFVMKEEMGKRDSKYIDGNRLKRLIGSIDLDIREA
ncbi:MAG TPA: AAA family ATPase [Candidatus Deferrimicrobium sp.]|nr:AAA family ATPase [Candidatus Kapabacteria bacterium]HLP61617.1 AAA family ATPase [Candidatus Deferrimicrobium sp.]